MADHSLNHCPASLNLNLHSYDLLSEHLNKAYALTSVALNQYFGSCPVSVIHDYLWILEDVLNQARNILDNTVPQDKRSVRNDYSR